jgi:hypothetical protein
VKSGITSELDYEDMLAQWADLEATLNVILLFPKRISNFSQRIDQLSDWMRRLLIQDIDIGLYLLFQLSNNSSVGYSASHALICASLCHCTAQALKLSDELHNSLLKAIFTMNIAMAHLQNELSQQIERPSNEQMMQIRTHSTRGRSLLESMGVQDNDWLLIVENHHKFHEMTASPINKLEEAMVILSVIDRFCALISPRRTRDGNSVVDATKKIIYTADTCVTNIGKSLIQRLGIYPPGTFVQLSDGRLAIVLLRKLGHPKQPVVVILTDASGNSLASLILHPTHMGAPNIVLGVAASRVNLAINHFQILHMAGRTQSSK